MDILEARNLGKVFTMVGGATLRALGGVSFELEKGELVSIIGPSGCGKSTLLNIIAGLLGAEEGEVYVQDGGTKQLITGPHPSVAVVFQEESVFPWRTSIRNVEFGLEMHGVSARERRARAQAMIELMGLSGFEHRYPSELSGGMRQRVAIARALVMEPAIMLMDEPFGALDEQTRFLLGEELLRIKDKLQQTILFITHNINEAVQLSDRVITMTARPGAIKDILDIDLPRPRDSNIIASEQFGKYVAQVWSTLREESLRSFRADTTTGGEIMTP